MREEFANGIAWGEAKNRLFELVDVQLAAARDRYETLMENPQQVELVLQKGAEKARKEGSALLAKLRHAVGIRPLA